MRNRGTILGAEVKGSVGKGGGNAEFCMEE